MENIALAQLVTKLVADTKQFTEELEKSIGDAKKWGENTEKEAEKAEKGFSARVIMMGNVASQVGMKIVDGIVGAITKVTSSIKGFISGGINLAGTFDEMRVSAIAVGQSMGTSSDEIERGIDVINKAGIRYDAAARTAAQFAKNQLDMAQAGKLAAAAQGAAVLLQADSSETMDRLVGAIARGESSILSGVGITKTFNTMQEEFAAKLGKSADALSQQEIMQARLNGVIDESASLMGVYAAASESPTKALRSLTGRSIPELQAALGGVFLPAFKTAIDGVKGFVSSLTTAVQEGGSLYPVLINIGAVVGMAADLFKSGMDKITGALKELGPFAEERGEVFADGISGGLQRSADHSRNFATEFIGNLSRTAEKALTWGINIATELATGLIKGASSAITGAMKFIGGMLTNWLSPGSPPKVAPDIDKWGATTATEYYKGWSDASLAPIKKLEGPIQSLLKSVGIGDTISNLAKKQLELAAATAAVGRAEEALVAAREKQAAAQEEVSGLADEYNKLLAEGADPAVLAAKQKEFEESKKRLQLADAEAKGAEKRDKQARSIIGPLEDQVAIQKELEKATTAAAKPGKKSKPPKLPKSTGKGTGADLASGIAGGLGDNLKDVIPNAIRDAISNAKEMISEKAKELFAPVVEAWEGLRDGPIADMKQAWEDMQEPITQFKDWLYEKLAPVKLFLEENVVAIIAGIGAALIVMAAPAVATWLTGVGVTIATAVVPGFISWAVAAGSAAIATITALAPVILTVTAIGLAVGLLVKAWQVDWGGIRTKFTEVWDKKLQPALGDLKEWLDKKVPAAIDVLKEFWNENLKPALETTKDFIINDLIPGISDLTVWIGEKVASAIDIAKGLFDQFLDIIGLVRTFIKTKLIPIFEDITEYISDTFNKAIEIAVGIIEGIKKAFDDVKSAIEGVIDFVKSLISLFDDLGKSVPDDLTPGSPPPLAKGFDAIGEAMNAVSMGAIPTLRTGLTGLNSGDTFNNTLNVTTEEKEPDIMYYYELSRAMYG